MESARLVWGQEESLTEHRMGLGWLWDSRDTVSALGITKLPNLPFASAIGYVRYFRQALALDERSVPDYPLFSGCCGRKLTLPLSLLI